MLNKANRAKLLGLAALFLLLQFTLAGCSEPQPEPLPEDKGEASHKSASQEDALSPPVVQAAHSGVAKQAFFGDLHIHSSWSLDAFAFGVRVGPEDAYKFARGGEIQHISGEPIKMQGPPLDFMALTEHANYMGISSSALIPGSETSKIPLIRDLMSSDPATNLKAMGSLFTRIGRDIFVPELDPDSVIEATWAQLVDLAEEHNTPGEFTAFAGYEYTSMPEGQNLHRNVIFRGSDVPARPFSTFDSPNPEDLWRWMENAREQGSDVMAIPHNANGSNGLMYELTNRAGEAIDANYVAIRLRNEPISEVMQIKGQSETHPVLSPNDEWAQFAMLENILGRPDAKGEIQGSYARQAMKDGLVMAEKKGFNPYQIGMIGSSDGHNASAPVEENNYSGKIGISDGTREIRILGSQKPEGFDFSEEERSSPFSAAGLAGVWAEENTREAIFDAMRAREVFATSGPRIRIRLFAGWDFEGDDLDGDIAAIGYAQGVPMGAEFAASGNAASAPRFIVQALQDPLEAPLERLQIIKSWVEGGQAKERVYDIACAGGGAPRADTHRCDLNVEPPNTETCVIDASLGSPELRTVWTDPDFNPQQRAFYYTRVIQIPTCRWSTFDAHKLGVQLPDDQPAWIQERAVSSPVWYMP